MSNQGDDERRVQIDPDRLREAQQAEFTRLYRARENINETLERMNLRLQNVERATPERQGRQVGGRNQVQQPEVEVDDHELEEEDAADVELIFPRGGGRRGRGTGRGRGRPNNNVNYGRNHRDEDGANRSFGSIELKIPNFRGTSDPEAYLQWEKQVELIFECHRCTEEKKVKLTVTQFTDYAIAWWDQLVTSRRRNLEYPIETWADLKSVMRKRFVPRHFHREIMQRLQVLKQGSKSVDDYYKEMEFFG